MIGQANLIETKYKKKVNALNLKMDVLQTENN